MIETESCTHVEKNIHHFAWQKLFNYHKLRESVYQQIFKTDKIT